MKRLVFTFSILVFLAFSTFAQTPKPTPKGSAKVNLAKTNKLALKEKGDFEKARTITDLNEKIAALQKFAEDYPQSNDRITALEIVVSTRAQMADEKLRAGDAEAGVKFFKDAVTDAPTPMSEKLFADVVFQFPTNLLALNQPNAAIEVAKLIEDKVSDNAKQLAAIATFYVAIEKSGEAKRLAQKAIALDSTLPVAYQTLGIASRLNFDLDESANSYAKALELDPNSVVSKRNLAEMKRAIGKSDEAVTLYQELVEKDASDIQSSNGLILSLFDTGKQEDAESALGKSLETNPNNLSLLVGAAYWYAANNNGDKAVELAQKAIALEPRYVWARIALARGLMLKNQPFEAEKTLLIAQQYGNFPTLEYELATARFQAGLFEEAATGLKRRFYVKDNYVQTYIAGRIAKEAESFTELLGLEREVTLFAPKAADEAETAEKIKRLLDFSLKLSAKETTEDELNKAVDEFTKGDDKMKMHRQLYVATRLLDAKKNLPKAMELTQNAVKGVDASLEISYPAAAVLADELVESRTIAISKGEIIVTPDIPRQTLSRIVRGRIEEMAGWTLYEQEKPQEAIVRFKRALSILPEKSSFWRSTLWRLGKAQFAVGNLKEALDSYIKSYNEGQPDRFRRATIEVVYQRLTGSLNGLDKLIGPNPFEETAQVTTTPKAQTLPSRTPEIVPATTVEAKTEGSPTPQIKPEITATPETTPEVKAEVTPTPEPSVIPTPTPEMTPTPNTTPEVKVTESATPTPEIKTETAPTLTPTPEVKVSETPETTPTATPEAKTSESPTPTPEIKAETAPTSTPETKVEKSPTPEIKVVESPSPTPETKTETTSSPTPKPLFDPIVITVPKPDNSNPPKETEKSAETKNSEKKESEQVKGDAKETEQTKESAKKESEQVKESEKKENEPTKENEQVAVNVNKTADPVSRPRVVSDKPDESEPSKTEIPSCLVSSQESLSILSNGGNLGILVGYATEGEIGKIKAESSNPSDVTVSYEPGIGRQSNRVFFVIKSVSDNKGTFIITFTSPCGKKEVQVRVR